MTASPLYDEAYARKYRAHDEALGGTPAYEQFVVWLGAVCRRFDHPIDVLDVGCGTGRYFWALEHVRSLTGLDPSAPMLAEARSPFRADKVTAQSVSLVCGDILTADFPRDSFDLVYSIGVLAEHAPLNRGVVQQVARWTRPGGRFAFTTVHPQSSSVPQTALRRTATALAPWLPTSARTSLRKRLLADGLYADERWVEDVLTPLFAIESLTLAHSEAHLHCLCIGRKVRA
jgi:SAM-dependent methyltransferase